MTEDPPAGGTPGDPARPPESYVWPLASLVLVILPQVLIPARLRQGPILVVPVVEGIVVLMLLLVAARPGPVPRGARPFILSLFGALVVANTSAAVRLVALVLRSTPKGQVPPTVTQLLVAAGLVLATNIVTFSLLYWQLDGGGPAGRAVDPVPYPDFQFPQTMTDGLAAPGWQPRFHDHLYLAFNSAIAFSPADSLPLTFRAKTLMALQAVISLSVLVVVVARVINILPG